MKKHILFSSGSLRMGGLERILVEYLNKIDKDRYKITLFILSDFGKLDVFRKDISEHIDIRFLKPEKLVTKTAYLKHNKKNLLNKIIYNLYMSLERHTLKKNFVKNLKEIEKVDVLIDFDSGLTKLSKETEHLKKIAWIHNSLPNLLKKEKKIRKRGIRLNNYDKIVTICKEMKEETEKIYPYLKEKIEYIYNPFDFDRIKKEAECTDELTAKEKDLLDDNYILSVSRIDRTQKDYPTLIKAYKLLKSKGIKQKLYIIGDGDFREELGRIIKNENLENDVKLLGQKKNPYVWMKNSDLFVHSSRYEGLPTVLIEAMILGKVVVSSACPTGPREILENGKSGLLFEIGDESEFAEKMFLALNNQNKRKELEENIKMRVKEFTPDKSLEKLDLVMRELGVQKNG
ncbi:MAG: glycosyltransferase [Fusobacteriales bacterium]|jgi:glycosyltransferase involved in cell wall biosynthesis|nr:glycosyltransferase [Fusobacteriales bacterium]